MYNVCFPAPAKEDFAQSIFAPFPPFINTTQISATATNSSTLSPLDVANHRRVAASMVRGLGPGPLSPHMFYNDVCNLNHVSQKYPNREVFVIRTEHEWEALKALELALGGPGTFHREGDAKEHLCERFAPSALSQDGINKLCCVLETEIRIYKELLIRTINLDDVSLKESMETIRSQCQVITIPWEFWHNMCRHCSTQERTYLRPDERQQLH
jgi:hypothetical protein